MKAIRFAFLGFVYAARTLFAQNIELPTTLPNYESFIVAKLEKKTFSAKDEEKIVVMMASGDTNEVQHQAEIEIPRETTASDAAAQWSKKERIQLLSWPQGLVIIRRKVGDKVERITWTMRQARTEAQKFKMQNGDVLIGLVYGDL